MAIRSVQSEGIHQQALRVVQAYNALRERRRTASSIATTSPSGCSPNSCSRSSCSTAAEPAVESEAGPVSLHDQTVAEIREENPEADEGEVVLRVAIRESIGMTRDEETQPTFGSQRLCKAVRHEGHVGIQVASLRSWPNQRAGVRNEQGRLI